MKLEVGMYVRTDRGKIGKLHKELKDYYELEYPRNVCDLVYKNRIIKSSFDILDLIEAGDILEINGEKYEVIYDESYEKLGILIPSKKELSIRHSALEYVFKKYEVAIVTKEQFEQMSYKVGD